MEKVENRSGNAHHVIMSYNGRIFYISTVRVSFHNGNERHKAIFHARETKDNPPEDLALEIPNNLYETLVKYANLNDPDLILVLEIEGNDFKWGFASESWLKKYSGKDNFHRYVV